MYLIKIEKFIFESQAWKLILIIGALTFFKTGIWYIPNLWSFQLIAENPFINPFSDPNAHYIFWSWLAPFLAWIIGAKSKLQFFAFHLLFSIAFTFLFIKISFVNFSDELARKSIVIFSVLPVSATSYFWVGPDSVTLFLMLLPLAFPTSKIFTFAIGLLLGMQHFEQAFFAYAGLLFAVAISHNQNYYLKYSWKFCASIFLGVIAGKFTLLVIFHHFSIEINSGRVHWLREHIHLLLDQFFFHFHYIIWSVLGLGWLLAIRFIDWGKKSIPFFLSLGGLCLLLPVSGDQTRVLSIIIFPLVSVYWLANSDFLIKISRSEVSILFTIWALMPWTWVWAGAPKWSVLPYDIAFIFHKFFGWFKVPIEHALWPF